MADLFQLSDEVTTRYSNDLNTKAGDLSTGTMTEDTETNISVVDNIDRSFQKFNDVITLLKENSVQEANNNQNMGDETYDADDHIARSFWGKDVMGRLTGQGKNSILRVVCIFSFIFAGIICTVGCRKEVLPEQNTPTFKENYIDCFRKIGARSGEEPYQYGAKVDTIATQMGLDYTDKSMTLMHVSQFDNVYIYDEYLKVYLYLYSKFSETKDSVTIENLLEEYENESDEIMENKLMVFYQMGGDQQTMYYLIEISKVYALFEEQTGESINGKQLKELELEDYIALEEWALDNSDSDEFPWIFRVNDDITADNLPKDENQQSDKNGNFIKLYSYSENADMKNDEDLSESMRTLINSSSEEEFIAMFLDDNESKTIVENSVYKMEMGELGDKNSIVFIIKNEEHEYPQIAYGLSYYESKVKNEAIISETVPGADSSGTKLDIFERIKALDGTEYWGIDFLKPLNAYQDISYIRDNEGKLIKAEYSSDSQVYGSYNSEGVLYYDADENPELKRYYTTGGTRYMAYVYDENKLIMICDFGGNPYKSLDDNPNIELGMDFKIYFLQ